jgi:DNA-binding response OmpR family regulator
MTGSTEILGARILIVDDQDSNVRLLEYALRRAGYLAVSSTTESRDVCGLHAQNPYDLIILDLQMPCMNGFEVMASLRLAVSEKRAAVLVLSGDPTQLVPVLEAGATDFLTKPFLLPDVLRRVHLILDKIVCGHAEELARHAFVRASVARARAVC